MNSHLDTGAFTVIILRAILIHKNTGSGAGFSGLMPSSRVYESWTLTKFHCLPLELTIVPTV
jgi:hypothetical protein